MNQPKHDTHARETELLGMTPGLMEDRPVIVITVRPDAKSFKPLNLAFSAQQFKRLVQDGQMLLKASTILQKAPEPIDAEAATKPPRKRKKK